MPARNLAILDNVTSSKSIFIYYPDGAEGDGRMVLGRYVAQNSRR